jgi:Mrp family chromosome partitioning ATPase
VALVDADLRSSRLRDALEVKPKGDGLAGVLRAKGSMPDAVQKIKVPGSGTLDFVDSGGPVDDAGDVLISNRATAVLDLLKSSYEYLVINGPPVLASADGLPLARWVDGVVLVVRAGRVDAAAVEESLEELRSVSAPVVGMVLTGAAAGRRRRTHTKKRTALRGPIKKAQPEGKSDAKKTDAKKADAKKADGNKPPERRPAVSA